MADSDDDKNKRSGARPAIPPFRGPGSAPRPPLTPPAGGGRPPLTPPAGGGRPPFMPPRPRPASPASTSPARAAAPVAPDARREVPVEASPPADEPRRDAAPPELTSTEAGAGGGAPWEPHATVPAAPDPELPAIERFGFETGRDANADPESAENAPAAWFGEVSERALESASTVERWTTPPTSQDDVAAEPSGVPAGDGGERAPDASEATPEKVGLYDDAGAGASGSTTEPPRAEDVISANVASEPVIDVAPQPEEERMPPAIASLQDTLTHEVMRHSHHGERAIYAMESAEEWAPSGESATRGGSAGAGEQAARALENLARRVRRGEVGIGELPASGSEAAVLAAVLAALLARRS